MLDEKLFWIEDIDFCYRANKTGRRVMYFPVVSLLHHSGRSISKNYKVALSNQVFNKIKFYRKHHTSTSTLVVKLISFINVLLRLIISIILSPFSKTAYAKMKAYAFAISRITDPPEKV